MTERTMHKYGTRLIGGELSKRLSAVPRTKAGYRDRRFSAVRELERRVALLPPVARPPVEPYNIELVSERRFPKALRPQIVTNGKGGWMTWEAWLNSSKTECAGMIFEDGTRLGAV